MYEVHVEVLSTSESQINFFIVFAPFFKFLHYDHDEKMSLRTTLPAFDLNQFWTLVDSNIQGRKTKLDIFAYSTSLVNAQFHNEWLQRAAIDFVCSEDMKLKCSATKQLCV